MNLGQIIRDFRKERGLTLNELADKIEISTSYLSALERNLRKPSIQVLRKISEKLNLPVNFLVGAQDDVFTGKKLVYMRESRGLSVEDLSEICDIPAGQLVKFEAGLETPDLDAVKKISEGLNVTIKFFLDLSENSNSIGKRIKKIRLDRGFTVTELAEKVNVTPGLISQIENGQTTPALETLQNIANNLYIPSSYLLMENKDVEDLLSTLNPDVIELLGDPNVQTVLRTLRGFQNNEIKYIINYIEFFQKNKNYLLP